MTPSSFIKSKRQPILNCVWGNLLLQYLDGELPIKELLDQTDSKQLILNFRKEKGK